jgi:hypothetical protein
MQRGTFLKKTGNAQYASHCLPSLNREGAMLSGGVSSRLSSLSIRSFGALCGEKEAVRHVDDPQFDIQWRRQRPEESIVVIKLNPLPRQGTIFSA